MANPYNVYTAPPKSYRYSRSEFPTEPILRRGSGNRKSSGSSDTDSKNGISPKTEKSRRFLFPGRRKKHQNIPETSLDSIVGGPGDIATGGTLKAIAYPSCAKEQQSTHTSKSYNSSPPIDSRNSQLRERETNPRRHSDSSYQSTRTFTQEQIQTPTPSEEQCDSPKSLQKPSFRHTTSGVVVNYVGPPPPAHNLLGDAPKNTTPPTERTLSPLRDRLSLAPRPLSSESGTLGVVEPSTPTHLEGKPLTRPQANPFRNMHTRPRSDQSEALGSWEEAVNWWYNSGEDEAAGQHTNYI